MASGDIDEPFPGGEIVKIADPAHVRRWNPKLAVHLVQLTGCLPVWDRRPVRHASDKALNTHALYQPCDCAAGDVEALATELVPDLADAVDAPVLFEDASDLGSPGSSLWARSDRRAGSARLPARAAVAFAVEDHPYGPLAHFRGKLARRLAHDAPSDSGGGAFGKPGAVQCAFQTILLAAGRAFGVQVRPWRGDRRNRPACCG